MLVVVLLVAIVLSYTWLKWNYSYWKRKKVPGPEPSFFVGNIASTLFMAEHPGVTGSKWYNDYPDEPYIGYYKMLKPAVLARDPDFIKDILTTNFDSFCDNDLAVSRRYDSLFATNPVVRKSNEWREARKNLTPMFSPIRLKTTMPVMNSVVADFVEFIKSYPAFTDLNAKEISTRFTTENVIKCLFSIEPGCFERGEQQQSEFMTVPQLFNPSFLTALKGLSIIYAPKSVVEYIPVPIVPEAVDKWFRKFVRTNKSSRTQICRSNDLFQTLLDIQAKKNYDDTFLTGSCLSLFLDGTETSAITLSYALFELARNPHCQDKVYEEVARIMAQNSGVLTYEAVQEMIYLESVLLEASRLHPTSLLLYKRCTKQYTLPKTSKQTEPTTTIEPGTVVHIPTYAIHMDPKNFQNPEEFKPERFGNEEQRNSHKYTFLTFGVGGRVCLGMRFAILQLKVALAHTVLNFKLSVSPSHKPIVVDPLSVFQNYAKDGILLHFETR